MKIGILTFMDTINYGASLQAYALQEIISRFGIEVEMIRYRNQSIDEKEKNRGIKSFTPKGILKKILIGKQMNSKISYFRKFEEQRLKFSPVYDEQTIVKTEKKYDKIVVGSDQVWCMGITQNDWRYYLDFIHDDSKKISYAPSFGNEKYADTNKEKGAILLDKFKFLSVREASGADLIYELTGRKAQVVLDPTLLLDRNQWMMQTDFIPKYKDYILVYFPHDKKKVFDFAFDLQRKTKLPIVYLSISPRIQKGVHTIYDASPEEFLGWVFHATYVVTGSFHGTAFSLNLGKEFYYEPSGEGSRIDNIVQFCGVQHRSIKNGFNQLDKIDYDSVWKKLESKRDESINWLRTALEE